MINIEELKRISALKGLNNIGNAEKDYLIDLILLSLSKNTKDELVFKGGTCLYKLYKLNRFSEDIDFTLAKEIDTKLLIKRIISDLSLFGIDAEVKSSKATPKAILTAIRMNGPLYRGTPQTASTIRIDINLKSSLDLKPMLTNYISIYPEIPSFSILTMQKKEILAEKARAIMTRTNAKDIYDLWFLLNNGIEFDINLVNKKLKYYNLEWNLNKFSSRITMKEKAWETELNQLIPDLPMFKVIKKHILTKLTH